MLDTQPRDIVISGRSVEVSRNEPSSSSAGSRHRYVHRKGVKEKRHHESTYRLQRLCPRIATGTLLLLSGLATGDIRVVGGVLLRHFCG